MVLNKIEPFLVKQTQEVQKCNDLQHNLIEKSQISWKWDNYACCFLLNPSDCYRGVFSRVVFNKRDFWDRFPRAYSSVVCQGCTVSAAHRLERSLKAGQWLMWLWPLFFCYAKIKVLLNGARTRGPLSASSWSYFFVFFPFCADNKYCMLWWNNKVMKKASNEVISRSIHVAASQI